MAAPKEQTPPATPPKGSWLKRNFASILMFLAVVGAMAALFVYQEEISLLQNWGYLGAFIIAIAANATVVLPMPGLVVLVPMGAAFNPFFIGLAAGVGGAMGEMTAYLAGYSGRGVFQQNKWYIRAAAWLKKWGTLVVFFFAATPLPIDVMGMAAGNLRYPAWKYLAACIPGKIIKYTILAYAGKEFYGSFVSSQHFRICLWWFCGGAAAAAVAVLLALLLERWTWNRTKAR